LADLPCSFTCPLWSCVGTTPVVCNDGNACTTDTCDTTTGCVFTPIPCPLPDQCHLLPGTCDPTSGVCSYPSKPNGTPCDDHNLCTKKDTCQAGICTGSKPIFCDDDDDHNPCTTDTCNPATGKCLHTTKSSGSSCNGDTCACGKCVGTPKNCDDGKPCTKDSCNPGTGKCINTPIKGCGTLLRSIEVDMTA